MHDGFLKVNSFSEPVIITNISAAQAMILRLLLLEKGTFQTHPDMGIGVLTRWRYRQFEDLPTLSLEIEQQIETYLPELSGSLVELAEVDKNLHIKINHNNIVYGFKVDDANSTIGPLY